MLAIIFAIVFLSAAALTWALVPDTTWRLVRRRIYSEVQATKAPSLLSQATNWLAPINQRLTSGQYLDWMGKRLSAAGSGVLPLQTLVVQEMGAFTGIMVYLLTRGDQPFNLGLLVFFAAIGFFVPSIRLDNRIRARRMSFTRDLPEVVDLLTLCVVAGQDFIGSLNRIVREFRPCPLRDALSLVLQEIQLGKRRADALRAFAQRVQTPEASAFARTLIQVDRMGTGLAEAMTVLSEDMRIQRYHWAERFAQQAPMKMLIPLICCLGAAMAVVAGPVLIKFFRGGLMNPPQMTASQPEAREGVYED